jgi:two-component system response regulator FixJ
MMEAGLAVEAYPTGEDFLEAYSPERPGCAILDLRMPGLSGLDVLARLAALPVAPPVILLTAHADVPVAVKAMKAGAVDILQKPFSPPQLLEAVRQALRWDEQLRQDRAERQEVAARLTTLTPRERDVLDRVVAGKANKVIAMELGVREKTVEVHRARVMEKMRAGSLAELVRLVLTARG